MPNRKAPDHERSIKPFNASTLATTRSAPTGTRSPYPSVEYVSAREVEEVESGIAARPAQGAQPEHIRTHGERARIKRDFGKVRSDERREQQHDALVSRTTSGCRARQHSQRLVMNRCRNC